MKSNKTNTVSPLTKLKMKVASPHRYHDLEIFLNEEKRPKSAKK